MSPLRRRGARPGIALLVLAAGTGALVDALGAGAPVDRLLGWVFLAALLPWALPLPRIASARGRRARSRRRLLAAGSAAAVAAASLSLGNGAAAFLAIQVPALLRGPRRASGGRRFKTAREAILGASAVLLLRGSPGALAGMAATTLLAAAALPGILAARRTSRPAGPRAPGPSARIQGPVLAAAVALLAPPIFLLLPRFGGSGPPRPAPVDAPDTRALRRGPALDRSRATTGVPMHEIRIGDIGRLQTDLRPLLEVSFFRDGRREAPEAHGPRLRSSALEEFDGIAWSSPAARGFVLEDRQDGSADGWVTLPHRRLPRPPAGERWEQELRFLAGGTDSLFSLGLAEAVGGEGARDGVMVLPRGEVRAAESYGEGARYRVRSVIARGPYPVVDGEEPEGARRARLLEIPPGHGRAVALARRELGDAGRGRELLRRLDDLLRSRCVYSLDILPPGRSTPVEAFLFESRRGHCELFASAAAVLLRGLGVPARVVVGFRGGQVDAASLDYTFRGADAHAWVEASLEGIGWVTVDPTPGSGVPGEGRDDSDGGGGGGGAPDLLGAILTFDAARQREVLLGALRAVGRGIGSLALDGAGRPDLPVLIPLAAALLALGLLLRHRRLHAAAGPARHDRALPPPPPPPEAWALLLRRLAAAGLRRGGAETVREFAARAAAAGAAPEADLRRIAAAGERERWGGVAPGAAEREALLALAAAVRLPPSPTTAAAPSA